MQPETPHPQNGPENLPSVERGPDSNNQESFPEKKSEAESGLNVGSERNETLSEARAATADASSSSTGILPPVVKTNNDDDNTDNSIAVPDDSPLVAADEDLIEKEWVDKAKKVINDTRHDPHQQEEKVSKLQSDYLKKRYGREINPTS